MRSIDLHTESRKHFRHAIPLLKTSCAVILHLRRHYKRGVNCYTLCLFGGQMAFILMKTGPVFWLCLNLFYLITIPSGYHGHERPLNKQRVFKLIFNRKNIAVDLQAKHLSLQLVKILLKLFWGTTTKNKSSAFG